MTPPFPGWIFCRGGTIQICQAPWTWIPDYGPRRCVRVHQVLWPLFFRGSRSHEEQPCLLVAQACGKHLGGCIPILSWAHLARTAAYLFKCFPFSFFGVYWLRDNEDVLLNYFGRLFRMGTAFCLSCFVPWLAGRLPDSRHCSPTSYRQDILSLAELSKRYRVPGCTISRTR